MHESVQKSTHGNSNCSLIVPTVVPTQQADEREHLAARMAIGELRLGRNFEVCNGESQFANGITQPASINFRPNFQNREMFCDKQVLTPRRLDPGTIIGSDQVSLLPGADLSKEVILVAALSGCGKTTYLCKLCQEGWLVFDDFKADAYDDSPKFHKSRKFNMLLSALNDGLECVLADIDSCNKEKREEAESIIQENVPCGEHLLAIL